MWIWLASLVLVKNESLLTNRRIQMDTCTVRAKMEERLLAVTAVGLQTGGLFWLAQVGEPNMAGDPLFFYCN